MSSTTKANRVIKSRNPKVNSKQKKILLQFLADHPAVYFHKITNDFTPEHHVKFWENAANVLNVFGPPIKTPEIWKKAWKDMRLRFRKAGIDVKQILLSLRTEKIIDTKALAESAEKLKTAKGEERDIILEECSIHESLLEEKNMLANYAMKSPRRRNFKVDVSKTREVAIELGLSSLEKKLRSETKDLKVQSPEGVANDDYEELYLDVEEIMKSEDELTNDSTSLPNDPTAEITYVDESKFLQMNYNNDDKDPTAFEEVSEAVSNVSSSNNRNDSNKTNGESSKILSSILIELRKHNNLQKEKLTMQKNFIDHQKLMMQHTLNVQKEMSKAQVALSNTVKAFVNNISFDS